MAIGIATGPHRPVVLRLLCASLLGELGKEVPGLGGAGGAFLPLLCLLGLETHLGHLEGDLLVGILPHQLCVLRFPVQPGGLCLLDPFGDLGLLALLLSQLVSTLGLQLLLSLDFFLVDVFDVPALLRVVNLALARAAQILTEPREGDPYSGVHVDVVLIRDELAVHRVGKHTLPGVLGAHELHEALLEFAGEGVEELAGRLDERLHHTLVALRHAMTLESVFVSALLLAHLAVPAELLKALGLHLVGQPFGRPRLSTRHGQQSRVNTHSSRAMTTLVGILR
mmetsp:Transcript_4414/g.10157  ORF Transcript_4414/g.10157 Transcript_4414/m.10157 type:complete len:282 (-) Transcript_4414:17-862(-)